MVTRPQGGGRRRAQKASAERRAQCYCDQPFSTAAGLRRDCEATTWPRRRRAPCTAPAPTTRIDRRCRHRYHARPPPPRVYSQTASALAERQGRATCVPTMTRSWRSQGRMTTTTTTTTTTEWRPGRSRLSPSGTFRVPTGNAMVPLGPRMARLGPRNWGDWDRDWGDWGLFQKATGLYTRATRPTLGATRGTDSRRQGRQHYTPGRVWAHGWATR